ncbi:MAG: hypothetical protein VX347_04340 [Bacteroidota bacterium]|nr:hypothetical protein [Bacteroidota bacterium]
MKKTIGYSLIAFFMLFSMSADAQWGSKRKSKKNTKQWKYEVKCIGEGKKGTYSLKVYSYTKKPTKAYVHDEAKRNAVHGVIFKGVSAGKCSSKPPLARNPNLENEKKEFFESFFADGGKYTKFVTVSSGIEPGDITKISKKEFKVGLNVAVNIDLLRKDLEAAGVIQGFGSLF